VTARRARAGLAHLDARGRARMVDVGGKPVTRRRAVARGRVRLGRAAFTAVREGTVPKGDVLAIARLAGIMGAKETSRLIPLCHPLPLTHVEVEVELERRTWSVVITATAEAEARTGVEMEAMTAVMAAALAVYDTCKSITKGIVVERVLLLEKTGGTSGTWRAPRGDIRSPAPRRRSRRAGQRAR
jgi:cyclic pyranopterin phosphate synthase